MKSAIEEVNSEASVGNDFANSWLNDRRVVRETPDNNWIHLGENPVVDGVLGVVVSDLHYACEATRDFDNSQNAPKAYSALEKVLEVSDSFDEEAAARIREVIEQELLKD